jgi:quercetin dioxygenase-like cupin family protein
MTKYIKLIDQCWETTEVRGVKMEHCPLWEGKHNVRSGFYRIPKGMQIPAHYHAYWVQILVMRGKMRVEAAGSETHIVATGEYYFVEPGETHVETALEETLVLVTEEEDREAFRQQPDRMR